MIERAAGGTGAGARDGGRSVAPHVHEVRVKCAVCGAHTTAWQGRALTGECGNCGSYDVRPLPRPPYERRP
jgi:ribosomal protein S27E